MEKKDGSFFLKYLKHEKKKISKFLTSKDLLIFLFFLLVSTSLWVLRALRTEYETIITIPISYAKAPEGLIQQEELPEHLFVTVTDDGTSLVRYRWMHTFTPIEIDVSTYTNGRYSIATANFEPHIQKQLNTTTKILRITPGNINLEFEELTSKEVPVVFNGRTTLSAQYIKSGKQEIKPSYVTLFGTKASLDTIKEVHTQYEELGNIQGTVSNTLKLEPIKGVSFSQDTVHYIIHSERYTEKVVEVPIRTLNTKRGFRIRTFPLMAKVKFHVGLSNYEKVTAEMLKVTANYKEAQASRIPLHVEGGEGLINAIEITPPSVDYLLEKND